MFKTHNKFVHLTFWSTLLFGVASPLYSKTQMTKALTTLEDQVKYVSLDDDELGYEEYLRIVGSKMKHWKSVEDFYLSTFDAYSFIDRGALTSFDQTNVNKAQYRSRLSGFLLEHYEVTLKGEELLIALCEDWNEQDYIICVGSVFIRYYWETGA